MEHKDASDEQAMAKPGKALAGVLLWIYDYDFFLAAGGAPTPISWGILRGHANGGRACVDLGPVARPGIDGARCSVGPVPCTGPKVAGRPDGAWEGACDHASLRETAYMQQIAKEIVSGLAILGAVPVGYADTDCQGAKAHLRQCLNSTNIDGEREPP